MGPGGRAGFPSSGGGLMYAIHLTEEQLRFVHAALIQAANHSRSMQDEHLTRHECPDLPMSARSFYWDRYRAWAKVEHQAIDLANQVEGDRRFGIEAYRLTGGSLMTD